MNIIIRTGEAQDQHSLEWRDGYTEISFSPNELQRCVDLNVYHKKHGEQPKLLTHRPLAAAEVRKLSESLKALLA